MAGSRGSGPDLDAASESDAARRAFGIFVGSDFHRQQGQAHRRRLGPGPSRKYRHPDGLRRCRAHRRSWWRVPSRALGRQLLLSTATSPGWARLPLISEDPTTRGSGRTGRGRLHRDQGLRALYFTNSIAVVDVAQKKITSAIDLSRFADASDSDGQVDVFDGTFDASAHRAYFLLQRIPQYEIGIDDRVSHYLPVTPLVIAVDTTNDELVALDRDAETAPSLSSARTRPRSSRTFRPGVCSSSTPGATIGLKGASGRRRRRASIHTAPRARDRSADPRVRRTSAASSTSTPAPSVCPVWCGSTPPTHSCPPTTRASAPTGMPGILQGPRSVPESRASRRSARGSWGGDRSWASRTSTSTLER